ncbi:MAG: HypC/HybG/HupF family hydrogenase formation chaperone [Anaerolineae bacterium]|nr:HypC/HybG/HupF family hydrogenase formation chaperone [Anaerolineae bacterium]
MCLAIPGEILEITGDTDDLMRTGKVRFGGVIREVNLAYVPDAQIGDYVIVHVGFALNKLDADEAKTVFEYLELIGEAEPEDDEVY